MKGMTRLKKLWSLGHHGIFIIQITTSAGGEIRNFSLININSHHKTMSIVIWINSDLKLICISILEVTHAIIYCLLAPDTYWMMLIHATESSLEATSRRLVYGNAVDLYLSGS
jgi:hypothetical protein